MTEPDKKKSRRLCTFKDEWLQRPEYRNWLIKASDDSGYCSVCRVQLTVKFDSAKAIKRHAETKGHKVKAQGQGWGRTSDKVSRRTDNAEEQPLHTAELLLAYHRVKHHLGDPSQDCGTQLYRCIFPDSKIASKIHCGMTNARALIENVLAPHSLKRAMQDIGSTPFSVATVASKKGPTKLFPVAIHYFNKDKGICTSIVDSFEDAAETSEAIADNLRRCLQKAGLIQNKIVAYGAGNFGENKSVFVHLKQMLDLPNLVPGHCSAQIVHDTAKHGLKKLPYDIEYLVFKVFSEFASSAKNISELKEFFDFMETEYSEILHQVPKRFVALFAAVDRLLKNWPALKSYFVSQGEAGVSHTIWAFLSEHKDTSSDEDSITLPELYLCFVHNMLSLCNTTIKVLESDSVQVTELYATLSKLRAEIRNRQEKGFHGYKVARLLERLQPDKQSKFLGDARQTYTRMLQYLEKRFDFSENSFYKLCAPLHLDGPLELDKLCALVTNLDVQVDLDELFTEICVLNEVLPILKGSDNHVDSTQPRRGRRHHPPASDVWVELFKCCEAPNLLKIVQHAFAVPPSSAFVERIFSIMANVGAEERNQLHTDLVRAELFVHFNYQMTCAEFAAFLQTGAATELLAAARNDETF
nr:uncharacterized protein LOC102461747 [Pelodiscus sinensis]XP_006110511.1 uncharacterized protein LOC102461747 [Pelodiscus sinensis]XP_006110513.1 uncharacterized protein LOC102461747 [Pelodiscus sinensis]XP_025035684.1 uncharacterized protein LOC102461747 [Pelodiscus sinensis]|eukprot:XP_006110510.1 uncharacterized protein LOC102461747 [Pelodiscus sinensis]